MAAVLTVAITLIAGAALFSYVNSQAATSESSLGQANAANVNYLDERFVVVDMGFSNATNSATLYLYNNGNVTGRLAEIILYNGNRSSLYAVFNSTTPDPAPSDYCGSLTNPSIGSADAFTFGQGGNQIPVGSTQKVTLNIPGQGCLVPGTTYYAIIVGLYGSTTVYYQCDPVSAQQQECTQ